MTARSCSSCGTPLPADAPGGLCPRCLLAGGLKDSGQTSDYAPFSPPDVAEIAALFPQLEIIELLGAGGMGAVYKARQPQLDRIVALKVLPRREDPAFAERFTREARALAKLSHPGIVMVHDFGQAGGLYYFVMEYVDGVNLRQAERGKLSAAEALAIVPQICTALQFAHDAGVVHRDIKPENILLDKQGRVKIADFGLAKLSGKEGPTPLTVTNQVMGTIHYMAPEQWEKPGSVDHRADIYSLGVVFYELLTGELPLGRFPLPSERVQIDVRLDDIVLRTLEKQPERRYQHASDVKTDVEKITSERVDQLSQEEIEAAIKEVPERIKELKETRYRLLGRHFDLWRQEYRRQHPEKFQPWSRKKRLVVIAYFAGLWLFVLALTAWQTISDKGLDVSKSDHVFPVLIVIMSLEGGLSVLRNRWNVESDRTVFVNKVGFWLRVLMTAALAILGISNIYAANPTVSLAINIILLIWATFPFAWHIMLYRMFRPVSGAEAKAPDGIISAATPAAPVRPSFFLHVALPAIALFVVWQISYSLLRSEITQARTASIEARGFDPNAILPVSTNQQITEVVCSVVAFFGPVVGIVLFFRWHWLAVGRRNPRAFWLMLGVFTVLFGLAGSALVKFVLLPRATTAVESSSPRNLIIGVWTWTDGRIGTSEFRADGTFEERFRETVPDVKVGELIDLEHQKFVEREGKLVGQYSWATRDVIWVTSPGKAPRQVTVVVTENELTIKENDGGVHRMKRVKSSDNKSP